MALDITTLFCCLDDFALLYQEWEKRQLLPASGPGQRRRAGKLSLSEMLFVMVLFHLSPFKDFKHFWLYGVEQKYRDCFRDLPSYPRFVALMPRLFAPLCVLLHSLSGEQTGVYMADSTKLGVCHNKRINRHRVFKKLAERGKTSMGWFFGLKLHIVINHKGELMAVKITPGNDDDRKSLGGMTKNLTGKLLADKGYISKDLFQKLWDRGLHLITGIRKNMRNYLLPKEDKELYKKRFLVETVFGILKKDMKIEHTRHRSPSNAFVHIFSCLIAYALGKNKPTCRTKMALA